MYRYSNKVNRGRARGREDSGERRKKRVKIGKGGRRERGRERGMETGKERGVESMETEREGGSFENLTYPRSQVGVLWTVVKNDPFSCKTLQFLC